MTQTATSLPTATGRLAEVKDGMIVLEVPGTSYRLHLVADAPPQAEPGQRVTGTVHARAKRVDVVHTGGRYIEPVYGRPRRIQGRVIGGDAESHRLFIQCGVPFICTLMPAQKPQDFAVGQLVACDVERGTEFDSV